MYQKENRRLVPDFVVGGAPKSGTTALCSYLSDHPKVFVTTPKEPHFYASSSLGRVVRGMNYSREEYEGLFADCEPSQVVGEGSTGYLRLATSVAPALYADNPHARLVFVLRNPIERAYSEYWFRLHTGHLPSSVLFSSYAEDPNHWVFHGGDEYAKNLRVFANVFGRDAVLAILTDDLKNDRAGTLARVCDHIGVDPSFDFPDAPKQNVTRYPRWPTAMAAAGHLAPGLSRWASRVSMLRGVRSRILFSKRAHKPPMAESDRTLLRDRFADEVAQLEDFLNRDLASWKRT